MPQRGILSEPGAMPWETVMVRRAVIIGLKPHAGMHAPLGQIQPLKTSVPKQ